MKDPYDQIKKKYSLGSALCAYFPFIGRDLIKYKVNIKR